MMSRLMAEITHEYFDLNICYPISAPQLKLTRILTHSLRQSDIVDYRAAYFAAKKVVVEMIVLPFPFLVKVIQPEWLPHIKLAIFYHYM